MGKHVLVLGFFWIVNVTVAVAQPSRGRAYAADTSEIIRLNTVANEYLQRNKPDSARLFLKPMLALSERRHFQTGLGMYYNTEGSLQRFAGNYEQAIRHYQRAMGAFEKSTRPWMVANLLSIIGYTYKLMGDSQQVTTLTRQGIGYLNRAIALNRANNRQAPLVGNYINLGICYEDVGALDSARVCFEKGVTIAQQTGDPDGFLRILYNNLGNNHLKRNEFRQAIPQLEKALALNVKGSRLSSQAHNCRNLATAYNGLNQPEQALHYAEKAAALVAQTNDVPLRQSVFKVLREIYAKAGRSQQAYEFLLREKTIEDSLLSLDKTKTIVRLQGQYEQQKAAELASIRANLELTKANQLAGIEAKNSREIAQIDADKKRRIAQIQAEAEVSKTRAVAEVQTRYETRKRLQRIAELDQENTRRERQLVGLAAGLGLLFLLLGIMAVQYRLIRRANRKLSTQNTVIARSNEQITEQSSQLRTLMRELHHRVKNNLAIVSSLLALQSYRLTDDGAARAVREGQRRVEAMALIHQRLYRTDTVTRIDMADYITDLAESLMRAYGYGPDSFDLHLTVEQHDMDVDVAIPLGLILNELLTNAFKYAYTRPAIGHRPSLHVALRQQDGLTLEVQDNGPGVNLTHWQTPDLDTDSFGRQLIWSLTEQVGGQLRVRNHNGAHFQLIIPQAA